ncbi:hypothetical protein JD508_15330 [Aeromonas jandaei]|uniref:hypothetical protein n=1 Tax=Aeromonas jandaei TaxID=650 RepID=UPI00191E6694|nr:hypothetical protein [Aeromonas jandaei]MBL0611611.1 hypothetical protein [Aeromonas jandaei]
MKKTLTLSKLSSLIILCLVMWGVYPFINGLGCDFPFEIDNSGYHIVGSCKNGTLKYATLFKRTGAVTIRKDLYGVIGHKVIAIRLDRRFYVSPEPGFSNLDDALTEYNYTSDFVRFYYLGRSSSVGDEYFFLQKSKYSNEGAPSLLFKFMTNGKMAFITPND